MPIAAALRFTNAVSCAHNNNMEQARRMVAPQSSQIVGSVEQTIKHTHQSQIAHCSDSSRHALISCPNDTTTKSHTGSCGAGPCALLPRTIPQHCPEPSNSSACLLPRNLRRFALSGIDSPRAPGKQSDTDTMQEPDTCVIPRSNPDSADFARIKVQLR